MESKTSRDIQKRIIDLSQLLATGMPTYPGDLPEPLIRSAVKNKIRTSIIRIGSHYGTHIDAPAHFFREGLTLLDYPLSRFFGQAVCLDKTESASGKIELTKNESALIEQLEPDWILIRSGFDRYWAQPCYFSKHPFLSEELIMRLLETSVIGIGVDFPSIDAADAEVTDYPVHRRWLGAGRLAVENLCNLQSLPQHEMFEFCALPLKTDTEGAPVRALAFL